MPVFIFIFLHLEAATIDAWMWKDNLLWEIKKKNQYIQCKDIS